jgi:hypothetical protein
MNTFTVFGNQTDQATFYDFEMAIYYADECLKEGINDVFVTTNFYKDEHNRVSTSPNRGARKGSGTIKTRKL